MIASVLRLSRHDCKALRITDPYSIHRVVYSLFEDTRSEAEKLTSKPNGILYADKGGDFKQRQILLLSDREPMQPEHGEVVSKQIPDAFLAHHRYGFKVTVNPTRRNNASRKLVPVKERKAVAEWFAERAGRSWGFEVIPEYLQIQRLGVQQFRKGEQTLTHGSATLKGELRVIDREHFVRSFRQGIGRGRAFGFGLLQIAPISNPFKR